MSQAVNNLITDYNTNFVSGNFEFQLGDQLSRKIAESGVIEGPGVYLIRETTGSKVLYIGKAGTLKHGGWSRQNLPARLKNRQGRVSRQKFFEQQLKTNKIIAIQIFWWVTHDDRNRILPAKAEMDLLQAYYDDFETIPPWNQEA